MFTFDQEKDVTDDIFLRLAQDNENIEFIQYGNDTELREIILKTTSRAAKMSNIDDINGFDNSLGGVLKENIMDFTNVSKVDNWQILSPYKNDALTGSVTINRHIHEHYRPNDKKDKVHWWTEKRLGNDGILYGDKVINIRNQTKNGSPTEESINYVANGEIGLVNWVGKGNHRLSFSSQPKTCYYFSSKISDNDSDLELAYALTVHKAQGSGFRTTIFVINEASKGANMFISREMIYTALTRQTDKIYILYNKEPIEMRKYSSSLCSDIARRLTNLFEIPVISKRHERYYSDRLIHVTRTGELVRSKSEVIIYNELNNAEIVFEYEKLLALPNGKRYSPDFTIYKNDGSIIYWEHLGMLSNAKYAENQEKKKADYKEYGISEEAGNLIVTIDEPNGAIDSSKIAHIIRDL
jgi:hypothetical protein